jgi:toxin ParE2
MTVIVLRQAEEELTESTLYYESKGPGLGKRLQDEVATTLDWILRHPEVPRLRPRGDRRVNLHIFPHYIAYIIRGDALWVVAIAHAHRRPEFWLERL